MAQASSLRWLCPHQHEASRHHLYAQIVSLFVDSLLELLFERLEKRAVIASPLEHLSEPPFVQKRQILEFPLRRAPIFLAPLEA